MAYNILNSDNITSYLLSLTTIASFFEDDQLHIEEIGDGNLNFVFLVSSSKNPQKKLIVKQAVPYLRCAGESYPLSKERMTYEIRSLQYFSNITPFVPKIYFSDEQMSVIIMEYLDGYIIMRKGMIEGTYYPNFAEHISSFLATTLFKTSSLYLSSKQKRELTAMFIGNTELCKLTEDFVFTAPFMQHETNAQLPELADIAQKISEDETLKVEILKLKYKFMNQSDALLHGDLHTGSIMINKEKTCVIDSEFAFVGPFGFDLGALIANLVMSWISHSIQDDSDKYSQWVLQTTIKVYKLFEEKFLALWDERSQSALFEDQFATQKMKKAYQKECMLSILQDTIGFAGCKIMRRQLGIAGVEDIRGIEDAALREKANRLALQIGEKFIKNHTNITQIEDILELLKA